MTVTDDDRQMAREHSRHRQSFHALRQDRNNKIADDLDDEEAVRRGLLGECAFANRFGERVDWTLRAGGDGGRDFSMSLQTNFGTRVFKVDVKTMSVRVSWSAVKHWVRLPVPCDRIERHTIYIGAIYLEPEDDAEVMVWEWGSRIVAHGERRAFDGQTVLNYMKPYKDCRDLAELERRVVRWARYQQR